MAYFQKMNFGAVDLIFLTKWVQGMKKALSLQIVT